MKPDKDLTKAQRGALIALVEAGGSGVVDKAGVVVASGERLAFDAATWLRLITFGLVESPSRLRLAATPAGTDTARALGAKR